MCAYACWLANGMNREIVKMLWMFWLSGNTRNAPTVSSICDSSHRSTDSPIHLCGIAFDAIERERERERVEGEWVQKWIILMMLLPLLLLSTQLSLQRHGPITNNQNKKKTELESYVPITIKLRTPQHAYTLLILLSCEWHQIDNGRLFFFLPFCLSPLTAFL